ncbi:hypothetical protein BJ170DRAFT_712188 [Xylariales sp. AK1849]|nr:hypothetical protein BJ170DRAFT_712188 [Xylariales sp. AK1849]
MCSVDEETASMVMVTPANGAELRLREVVEPTLEETAMYVDKAGDSESKDEDSSDTGTSGYGDKKEKFTVGMVTDRKDLYQVMDRYNRLTWTERCPEHLEEVAEHEEILKYAVLVRNRPSSDTRKKLEVDSIVVQSPLLKSVLRDILHGYPGVTTNLAKLTFNAPFRPFVHRWRQFTAALDGHYDETTKTHLRTLHQVLHEELKDVITATKDYVENGVIAYEHVWTIFQPGTKVYASSYGRPAAVRLTEGKFVNHCKLGACYLLKCDRVDWDGSKFGYDTLQHAILPFVGTLPITELDVFPLEFHSDQAAITASLTARGAIFERLAGYHYKAYRGQAIERTKYGPAQITVECRVVIDAYAHGKANPDHQFDLDRPFDPDHRFNSDHQSKLRPLKSVQVTRDVQSNDADDDDYAYRRRDSDDPDGREDEVFVSGNYQPLSLTDEQLILCTPTVKGYDLRTLKWLEFFVDGISEIVFNENAFNSLVLPEGHKFLILAVAQSQTKYMNSLDDVISGNGRGVIMLLSGGSGIGKTMTAESVAEVMRVPLYKMSAGDFGFYSGQIDSKLTEVLAMVAKWNAVLLLDEFDVFLEVRSTHDVERNRAASIFLRTLEYYEGILILTTNRVKNVDESLRSRIHISLEYPPLDAIARKAIWSGFLERSVDFGNARHELTDQDLGKLAKVEINGRVISNVLKTSNLLACHKGEILSYKHVRTVLQIEGHLLED